MVMEEIKVKVELENYGDRYMFLENKIKESPIYPSLKLK